MGLFNVVFIKNNITRRKINIYSDSLLSDRNSVVIKYK